MHRFQQCLKPYNVKLRAAVFINAEIQVTRLAAECGALQIQKTSYPLQIGQCHRVSFNQPLKLAAAGDMEFQKVNEIRVMTLQHMEQSGDISADIVDHFCFRPLIASQEDATEANERFSITVVVDGMMRSMMVFESRRLPPRYGSGRFVGSTYVSLSIMCNILVQPLQTVMVEWLTWPEMVDAPASAASYFDRTGTGGFE